MNNLGGEMDPKMKGLMESASKYAVEIAAKIQEKIGKDVPRPDYELFSATFMATLASATYGLAFRDRGEKAADRWLEFFLSGVTEGLQGLGLRRCFAFARDPIVLDPRSGPSAPSSPTT